MRLIRQYYRAYKEFIVPIATLIICVIALAVGIIPLGKSGLSKYWKLQSLKSHVEVLQKKSMALDEVDEVNLRAQLDGLLEALPSDKNPATILTTTDGVARQSEVTLTDISLGSFGLLASDSGSKKLTTVEKKIGSNELSFVASVVGSVLSLRNYLDAIPSVRRLLRIKSFSMQLSSPSESRMSMNLQAFYAPFPMTIGKVDDPLPVMTPDEQERMARVLAMPLMGQGADFSESASSEVKEDPFSR